jgi:hypothetical protein
VRDVAEVEPMQPNKSSSGARRRRGRAGVFVRQVVVAYGVVDVEPV